MRQFYALSTVFLLIALTIPEDVEARGRGGFRGGFGRGFGRGFGGRGFGRGFFWGGRVNPSDSNDGQSEPSNWVDPYPKYEKDNNGYWGGWGGIRGRHRWGTAGGFARPNHRFVEYGWGGWSTPYYGTGAGYSSKSFSEHSIDAAGNLYPPNSYRFSTSVANLKPIEEDIPDKKIECKSKYRLGPDADILKDGKIAFHLTPTAFLMASNNKIVVVDETTKYSGIVLYPDKVLMWHLAQEIDQQSMGLKAAIKRKGALFNSPIIKASKEKTKELHTELDNIDKTIALLDAARNNLGKVDKLAPGQEAPPEPGAIEIFSSTWMSADGKFVIAKLEDGSYIWIDGKGVYTDNKKTALKRQYPGIFVKVVFDYLNILVKESKIATKNLKEDKKNTRWALEKLKSDANKNKSPKSSKSQFHLEISKQHVNQAILRTQHRDAAITSQLSSMPKEIAIAKILIKSLSQ